MSKCLRDYQSAALDALYMYWATGGGHCLLVLPTGSGKSLVAAALIGEMVMRYDMRIAVLTHVRELIEQDFAELIALLDAVDVGIYSAGIGRRDIGHRVTLAGVQSVFRNPKVLGAVDLVIVDEAHLIGRRAESMYGSVLATLTKRVPDLRVVGLTATPYRLDSGRLHEGEGRLFDDIVYEASTAELMEDGFLCKSRLVATETGVDVGSVAIRRGEFKADELERAAMAGDLVEETCAELLRLAEDRGSILIFCVGVDHALAVCAELRRRGVEAESVFGNTPKDERDRIVAAFRNGGVRVLVNVNVLAVGYNAPGIDCIVMLRPTMSPGLYVQQVGRGFRAYPGKNECVVLDFAGNVNRHGPVDAPAIGRAERNGHQAKKCPSCHTLNALRARSCDWCGAVFPAPKWVGRSEKSGEMERQLPTATASGGALFAADQLPSNELPVLAWQFARHQKPGKPDSLRVTYRTGKGLLGHSEWVCLEHKGAARWRSVNWWTEHGGDKPVPVTVTEALERTHELERPATVSMRREEGFWRVVGRQFERDAA